jgi:hypothetical protein
MLFCMECHSQVASFQYFDGTILIHPSPYGQHNGTKHFIRSSFFDVSYWIQTCLWVYSYCCMQYLD